MHGRAPYGFSTRTSADAPKPTVRIGGGMRIILVGQAAFAEQVLQRLIDRGDTVGAVYCPPDRSGGRPDPVKVRATDLAIPVRQHASLKRPEVVEEFRSLQADLGVLAYVTQIVPESVIRIPHLGTICFHPSLLPRYRGGSAINWQLINGETRTGVTVFETDAGIDTGPIIVQKEAEIGPNATAGSLYYDTLFPLGVEAVLEAVALIDASTAPRIPQDERNATYDPLCRDEHAAVSWDRPARDVHNLVRGCDPQPGAFTQIAGRKVRLYDATLEADAAGGEPPGTVVGISAEGMRVAACGGIVRIGRVRPDDERAKVGAADFARAVGLEASTRLGS
jgi:methionyl-tRNA formyltransferase